MIINIDHVGIAVRSLSERLPFWSEALGMTVHDIETVASENVKVAMLPAGLSGVELLEPTGEGSTVAKFIERRGEGIHHLTLRVSDIVATLQHLAEHGVAPLGQAPRGGSRGSRVAFLDPKSTGGVLIELVERTEQEVPEAPQIGPGEPILAYLREPQDKLWGVLRRLDASGVVLEAIDLGSFDDWVAQVECDEENIVGPSVLFIPMGRVEKILLDSPSGRIPSLAQRFEHRTGRTVHEVLSLMRGR